MAADISHVGGASLFGAAQLLDIRKLRVSRGFSIELADLQTKERRRKQTCSWVKTALRHDNMTSRTEART